MKKIGLIGLISLIGLIGLIGPVRAQEVSLGIAPPLLEVMIQPGKSVTQAYEVINQSNNDLYLRARIVPFEPADQRGGIKLIAKDQWSGTNQLFSLANANLTLGQTFKLSANSRKQLVLKIAPPKDWPEDDYYYTFLIEQSPEGEFLSPLGSQTLVKVGSNILLTVSQSGQPIKEATISQFSVRPKIADLFDAVKFTLLVENVGQGYFKPQGKIEIYSQPGKKKVAELELRPDNVLVNSAREILCQDGPCLFHSWRPGYYRAVVSFLPDGTGAEVSAQVAFWLLPLKLTLSLIIVFLVLFALKKKQFLDKRFRT